MTFRIFSRLHNLYTNSPCWPSNQRTWSDWALSNSGEVLEMVFADGTGSCSIKEHDKRDFDVEPWTGYFDSRGKKIYRGDVIKLSCFNLDYEVVWNFDRFSLKALYDGYAGEIYPWPTSIDCSANYEITGNIHRIEHAD